MISRVVMSSPLASSFWALATGHGTPTQSGLGKTLSSMMTSQSAWRSAPCSLSLSCNGLTLPCSQMSNRTYSCGSVDDQQTEGGFNILTLYFYNIGMTMN